MVASLRRSSLTMMTPSPVSMLPRLTTSPPIEATPPVAGTRTTVPSLTNTSSSGSSGVRYAPEVAEGRSSIVASLVHGPA